jgi:hypothetical protein
VASVFVEVIVVATVVQRVVGRLRKVDVDRLKEVLVVVQMNVVQDVDRLKEALVVVQMNVVQDVGHLRKAVVDRLRKAVVDRLRKADVGRLRKAVVALMNAVRIENRIKVNRGMMRSRS